MFVSALLIGAFYIFAGVVALRVIRLGSLMDGLLEAVDGTKPASKERIKTVVLTIGALATTASGAALLALGNVALPFFVAGAVIQAGYLVWAQRSLVPEDDADRRGRQQTINAFVIYLAATAYVAWLVTTGELRAWPSDVHQLALECAIPALAMLAAWLSLELPLGRSMGGSASLELPAYEPDPQKPPVNLRLRPDWQCYPLWDMDTGDGVSHYSLDLSQELMDRIEMWDDSWQDTYNGDDPASSGFKTDEERAAWRAEGKAIAAELRKVWPGKLEIDEQFR
jgi:hypothetical protein